MRGASTSQVEKSIQASMRPYKALVLSVRFVRVHTGGLRPCVS